MISKGRASIEFCDLKEIESKVSDLDLLYHYMNLTTVPCIINSPLRIDHKPSLGIFQSRDNINKLKYKDLAKGDSGDLIDLFSKMWNMPFEDVIRKIEKDLPLIRRNEIVVNPSMRGDRSSIKGKITMGGTVDLQVKVRPWYKYDYDFWETYGISKDWLEFGKIYPISYIINKYSDGGSQTKRAEKYAYVYVEFKDNKPSLKIYQPFSEKFKWRNKHDHSVWDLWEQLPESGDKLIITSSRKDALCIWENTGIPSVSLQSETCIPKAHIMDILKARFKNIYILYDNDTKSEINYGQESGKRLAKEFDLINICIPTELQAKDPSDVAKKWGRNKVTEIIQLLLKN